MAIVKVNPDDWEILQQIAITTFRDTYEKFNDPVNFKTYLENAFNQERLLQEISHPHSDFYFLKKENTVVGYIKLNEYASQTEPEGDDALEVERIYVVKEEQGKGYGKLLIQKAIAVAQAKGKNKLWLAVWEKNPNAIRFYKKMGFEVYGTHIFQMNDEPQIDFMMKIDL